jgi:tRNA(Ile)-lysidine synthase TilS/MesJ
MIKIFWGIKHLSQPEIIYNNYSNYTIDYNWKMLPKTLQKAMPDLERSVLMGVSGGTDSVALLH